MTGNDRPSQPGWTGRSVVVMDNRSEVRDFLTTRRARIGDLTLAYESMELTADQGLRLNAYTAEPGSPSQEALTFLASWTTEQPDKENRGDPTEAAEHRGTGGDVHR